MAGRGNLLPLHPVNAQLQLHQMSLVYRVSNVLPRMYGLLLDNSEVSSSLVHSPGWKSRYDVLAGPCSPGVKLVHEQHSLYVAVLLCEVTVGPHADFQQFCAYIVCGSGLWDAEVSIASHLSFWCRSVAGVMSTLLRSSLRLQPLDGMQAAGAEFVYRWFASVL